MSAAIETRDLVKKFGNLAALDGVSLSVEEGELFGLLGPNGAGKTTLIRILATLMKPSGGSASIMGLDVVKESTKVRKLLGVVSQAMTSDLDLTARETMDIYSRIYGMTGKKRKQRIDRLLEMVGLDKRADDLVATYSGGMRRRLEVARGLVHRPSILILDEPTIGLDPQSRHVVWEILNRFRTEDRLTILLTTHYMEEAEVLSDRVAIIDDGRIAAVDSVEGLKEKIPAKDIIEFTITGISVAKASERLNALPYVNACTAADSSTLKVSVDNGLEAMPGLTEALKSLNANITHIVLKQQTLEDVFIHFTGRGIREEEAKKVSFLIGAGIPRKIGG